MDDARQVFQLRHLDRPFHQRPRHGHQIAVQHRLGQAVALFLLAGGQDHRGVGEFGIEQRTHGVAQPGRDMNVAGDQLARGAGIAVGHGDDERLLQAQDVS